MFLHSIESGNYIKLVKKVRKGYDEYLIELKNLKDIKIIEQTSGYIIKRQDLLLEITFVDDDSAGIVKERHTIMIDVEENDAYTIIDLVKKFKDIEENSGFWTRSQVTYHIPNGKQITSDIFLEAPFVIQGEIVKWIWWIVERKEDKVTISYLRALTNFRVFKYNYKVHNGRAMPLKNIEDVSVIIREENKKGISKNESKYGVFTEGCKIVECNETNIAKVKTIGDVTFIANGEPFATFRSVGNPEDIARIVKKEKENILSFDTQTQSKVITYDWKGKYPFDIVSILGTSICAVCHKELRYTRYNPKKEWHIDGQLCGECFLNPTRLGTKQISSEEDAQYACLMCRKNVFSFEFESEDLCFSCFEQKYGKLLLTADRGEYYGGHKVHLAGGTFGDYESGKMYLTEDHLIFAKGNKEKSKKWEIMIPLNSVILEQWNIKGESRRKQITAGGMSSGNVAFGGGTIHETGQRHRLLIPYADENGIIQQPIFGISSYGGKDIRKWAEKLYEQLVEVKQRSLQVVNEKVLADNNNDPISVLKLRFAKGEISKEEYENMRKIIES